MRVFSTHCALNCAPNIPLIMAKRCFFCPRPVDSAEHLWSNWILEDLNPVQPIHIKFGKTFAKWVDDPEVRVHCVCQKCNNEWMNDIECENKPHVSAMMNDKPVVLRPSEQELLTRWAVLKAMVLDGGSPKRRTVPFYSECERISMKPPLRALPVGTFAWIGKLSVKAFHAELFDTFGQINAIPKAFHGCITTIIVGHLIIQVVTMHVLPMFAARGVMPRHEPGAWDVNLLEMWPAFGDKSWPPPFPFVLKGMTPHHIERLVRRFRIGEDITK